MGVQLSDDTLSDLKDGLFKGINEAINGNPGRTITGKPVSQFLADPPPGDPLGQFQHRSGRAVCDRWARGQRPNILPGRELYYRQLCEPYLGDAYPDNASYDPPFTGGQCVTRYLVYATVNGVDINIGGQTPLEILGPLSAPSFSTTVVGSPFPDSTRYQWVFASDPSQVLQFVSRATFTSNPSFRVAGRVDSQPDNCGDPTPEFDQGEREPSADPNPGPVGGPTGFPFPNVDISINPDGTINVDFGDGEPPGTIDPGAPDTAPGGGAAPGDIGSPGGTGGTGVGGETEGEAPSGSVLTALKIDIATIPSFARPYRPGVYRAVCYAYMGTADGLDLDPAGALLESGQLILAEKENLTKWKVLANSGYDLDVTPYYKQVTE